MPEGPRLQKWISLAEVVLANLAWIDELDIEGWLLVTILVAAAGVAIWLLFGVFWLLLAASLYLGLLVAVRVLVVRAERRRRSSRRV
jgi:hypothetical protein